MEVRKLIKMGKSSCVVSLPKKWIDSSRLKPGSNVYIDDSKSGGLVLNAESSKKGANEVTLKIEDGFKKDYLKRILLSKYLNGFERIEIESRDMLAPELREEVSKISNALIGLEIVEEGMKRISMECLVKPGELPIDKLIRRMYLLAKDMHKDSVGILSQKNKLLAKTIIERDSTINKLYYLSLRYLHMATTPATMRGIDMEARDCLYYQTISRCLERIANHVKNIAKYLSRVRAGRIPKTLIKRIEGVNLKINNLFDLSMKAFFKNDGKMANSVIQNIEAVREELKEMVQNALRLRSETALNMALALDSSLRIAEYSAEIGEVVIDRAV